MVVVKRQIPGIGPTKVCEFPRDINDLDEAEKELDWLFRIFTKNNYELERRDWNFPRNSTMIFEKKLTAQTPNIDWEDVWIRSNKITSAVVGAFYFFPEVEPLLTFYFR